MGVQRLGACAVAVLRAGIGFRENDVHVFSEHFALLGGAIGHAAEPAGTLGCVVAVIDAYHRVAFAPRIWMISAPNSVVCPMQQKIPGIVGSTLSPCQGA